MRWPTRLLGKWKSVLVSMLRPSLGTDLFTPMLFGVSCLRLFRVFSKLSYGPQMVFRHPLFNGNLAIGHGGRARETEPMRLWSMVARQVSGGTCRVPGRAVRSPVRSPLRRVFVRRPQILDLRAPDRYLYLINYAHFIGSP